MNERVWQRGSGWIRLRLTSDGIAHEIDEPEYWALAEAGGIIASIAGLLLFGVASLLQLQAGARSFALTLACLALLTGYYAFKKGIESLIADATLIAVILLGLFLVPFKAGRRRIKRWWAGDGSYRFTLYRQLDRATVYWCFGTHVTLRRHGAPAVKLRAVGAKGRRLADAMRRVTQIGS